MPGSGSLRPPQGRRLGVLALFIAVLHGVVAASAQADAAPTDAGVADVRDMMLAAASTALSDASDCTWRDPGTGAQYNLAALRMSGGSGYPVLDAGSASSDPNRRYIYYFNVCGNVTAPSSTCDKVDPPPARVGPGPVFQTKADDDQCYRLGTVAANGQFDLLPSRDPSKGLRLTYSDGEYCQAHGRARSFVINFNCIPAGAHPGPTAVSEDRCEYALDFDSQHACPLQCVQSRNVMCGGHGFCGYDRETNRPRCFCNPGHGGASCAANSKDDGFMSDIACDSTCAVLAVVVTFLFILILAGGVMLWRIHKLSKLNVKFEKALDDKEPEEIQTFPALALND